MVDFKGLLWISTANGVNIYDAVHKKLKLFKPPNKFYSPMAMEVVCMLHDHADNVWLGLRNKGLYRYNLATGNSKYYHHSFSDASSLCGDGVNTLIEDAQNKIWVGLYPGGVSIYSPEQDNFINCYMHENRIHSLNSNQIINMYPDRTGVIWIATNGAGLINSYPALKKFTVCQNYDSDYISHYPLSLYKDPEDKMFMTTLGSGVQQFQYDTKSFKAYKYPLLNNALSNINFCYASFKASDGNFYVCGYNNSFAILNIATSKFTIIESHDFHNVFNCMAEDMNKKLWIGTNDGLEYYDLRTHVLSTFKNLFIKNDDPFNDGIVALHCDYEGILWIAGAKGLSLLNTKTGKVKTYQHSDANSVSNNTISSFYFENENSKNDGKKVWIGTDGGGLNLFDKETGTFVSYNMKDGLPDNSIKGISLMNKRTSG